MCCSGQALFLDPHAPPPPSFFPSPIRRRWRLRVVSRTGLWSYDWSWRRIVSLGSRPQDIARRWRQSLAGREVGDGLVYRVVMEVQQKFWNPPDLSCSNDMSKYMNVRSASSVLAAGSRAPVASWADKDRGRGR